MIDTEIYNGIRGTVFKFYYGDKYIISMGKYLKNALEINKVFNTASASGKKAAILNHLKSDASINSMEVFVLEECKECDFQTTEQKWLHQSKGDTNCLNSNFVSYTTPHVAMRNNFKPVTVKPEFVFNTKREVSLYEKFLSELNQVRINPRVNLNKWY